MKTSHADRVRYELKEALTITVGDGETLDQKLGSVQAEAEVAARVWYLTTHKIVPGDNDGIYSYVADITGLGMIVRVSGSSVPERVYLAFPLSVSADGELLLGEPYPVEMRITYVPAKEAKESNSDLGKMLLEYERADQSRRSQIKDALREELKKRAFDTALDADRAFLNGAQRILPAEVAALISATPQT